MTQRAEFTFTVKEGANGEPSIVAEPTAELAGFRGLIGFDLKPGTHLETAEILASLMRKHIRGLSLTP